MQTNYHILILFITALMPPFSHAADVLFDVHLHYNATDAALYNPQQIIEKLDRNGIRFAVVTGTPPSHTATLYKHAPERVVPVLGVYHSYKDKTQWIYDTSLPDRVKQALDAGHWHGIGELHIFAKDRHSPVFRQIVKIASERQLSLMIHGDPAVIDTVYDIAPMQTVVWAHAGTFPYPDLLADYLSRYPALYIDLSVRDEQIAPLGQIDDSWYELFLKFPGRFMIGVDTYSVKRWRHLDDAVIKIRKWLAQLPVDVARQIGYDNAVTIFAKSINRSR